MPLPGREGQGLESRFRYQSGSFRYPLRIENMDLKEFAKYIQGKSPSQLLHRARKESLKLILAHEETLEASRKKPTQKRTGTR